MADTSWKRKEYDTWDEAFRGLAPAVRQQSIRVAAYTQALFVQACADHFGGGSEAGKARIRGQYADTAYKCGLYHQLGKAMVPPEYQILQRDFTEEELAVYRKYTTDGLALVIGLQAKSLSLRDKRKGRKTGYATENVPWLMIRESCQQHMERWDGSGYPDGRKGDEISPIAQIVGIARELDRLAAETRSETPFEDAYAALMEGKGTLWSDELIAVLANAREKCEEVYRKYIHYTMTIPTTIPLVVKRPDRPFGLNYRPMVAEKDGPAAAYEAIPWFGDMVRDGSGESLEDQQELLKRTGLVTDLTMYLLYEAADTLVRIDNCKLPVQSIVVQVLPDFWLHGSRLQDLVKLYEDEGIDRSRLLLTIPEDVVFRANKTNTELITRYLRNGIPLVLDGYSLEKLPVARLEEMGFTWLRLDPSLYLQQTTANTMYELRKTGFKLIGGGADTHDLLAWQLAAGVVYTGGTMTGVPAGEDDVIRDALLRERS